MRNVTPTTVASKNLVTSSQVAAAVPPVARTSSTIQHSVVGVQDRVAVHLEHVVAVLELVAVGVRVPGQLALFAHGHEAGPELCRRIGAARMNPACLHADHLGDRPLERRHHQLGGGAERVRDRRAAG